jgi:predicted O-methyltransferase YrrM
MPEQSQSPQPPLALHVGAPATLRTDEGEVALESVPGGRLRVELHPFDQGLFVPRRTVETSLPAAVVEALLRQSFARLCDNLARHEDPQYVIGAVIDQLAAYCEADELTGRRLLDFGCGTGASTVCIGAMFPHTEVVGVELDAESAAIARRIAGARGLANVRFEVSPHGAALPAGIGKFDYVMLSAVYEHLLPEERRLVLPRIWSAMRPGGVLFVNQTPHRFFPYEHHSTGLWFINYLPDSVAFFLAQRFSRINREDNRRRDWRGHLRGGLRGGTEREILRNLSGSAAVLQPRHGDRAGYWLARTSAERYPRVKRLVAAFFRFTDRWLGTVPALNLDVAFRKLQ